ncbi:MAG: hypothetical protein QF890_17395 [Myxococcota bacterium]|nr:hypothetical protein [bacterium]MDP7075282.1 hypothetical protein [Myxococcota bacterium]MDP7434336.1 hypothetical protein [Myxococcota bacterium]
MPAPVYRRHLHRHPAAHGEMTHKGYFAPEFYRPALGLLRRSGSPLVYSDSPGARMDML